MKLYTFFLCVTAAGSPLPQPLFFEPNQGQASAGTDFVARQGNRVSLLKGREAELSLGNVPVHLQFADALNPSAAPFGQLPGTSNYLHGNDPRSWKTGIPQYGGVRYSGLYPGIDLVYHAGGGSIEYDFVLAPNADPRRIAVKFSGLEKIGLEENGDLRLETKAGPIRQHRPVVYQESNGRRRLVSAHYELDSAGVVRLALGRYDHSRTLVIDPTLDYSSYFGGPGGSSIDDIKVDSNGDVYMTGNTPTPLSSNGSNPFTGNYQTPLDAYVMKFSPSRNAVLFFTSFGGSSFDGALSLAVDPAGNIAVGGYTISLDFPLKDPVHRRTKTIFLDGFVTKFASDGKTIIFSTYLGGDNIDNLHRIMTDAGGNTYICGSTTSQDFLSQSGLPTKFPGFSLTSLAFLTKLSPSGSVVYSGMYGGLAGSNEARGFALDSAGNVYLSGWTEALDFPVQNRLPGTTPSSGASPQHPGAWLAKVAPDGKTVAYSTMLTGLGLPSIAEAVAVDRQGNPIVAGYTAAQIPIKNAIQTTYGGGSTDGFVMKINAAGNDFLYSTYLGGNGADQIWALTLDGDGAAYVAGWTKDGSFPQRDSVQPYRGLQDSFVSVISPSGDRLVYSSLLGGTEDEFTKAIALDTRGSVYVAGMTRSPNFPTKNAFQQEFPSLQNEAGAIGYLYRLSAVNPVIPVLQLNPSVLSFVTDVGGPAPASQSLSVSAVGAVTIAPFTVRIISAVAGWLSATPSTGTTPAQLSVSANSSRLDAGVYTATIEVTPQGGPPVSASVSLRIYTPGTVAQSVSPNLISQGAGDTEVTIKGANIAPGATVSMLLPAALPLASKVIDSTTIRATISSLYTAAPGTISLVVTNPLAQPSSILNVTVAPILPLLREDGGIVNSATLGGRTIAPGELITLFGHYFTTSPAASGQFDSSGKLGTILNGARVLINGQAIPLLYVSATQINAIAPYGIAGSSTAALQLELNGRQSVSIAVPVAAAAPGIFTVSGTGSGAGAILNETSSVNSAQVPAQPGSIIVIYATGAGVMDTTRQDGTLVATLARPVAPVAVEIDGRDAAVLYAGSAPGLVEGVIQVNARVPMGTRSGADVPVRIRVGTVASQAAVTVAVR